MIVPAWKGMETLQRFYETSADWRFAERPLTHAGGIVFCSHKTPIAEATRAAEALANHVKSFSRTENRFDYLVLESIDYPTQEIRAFRELRYGVETSKSLTPLAPFARRMAPGEIEHLPWDQRVKEIAGLLERLPRGALYEIAQAWVRCETRPGPASRDELDALVRRLVEVNGKDFLKNLQSRLFEVFVPAHDPETGHDHAGWLHLAELWDYLAPLAATTRRARS